MKIKYAKNNKILHIRIGKYHALISRNAGIIRNEGRDKPVDLMDVYMTICVVCLSLAMMLYEVGMFCTATVLCGIATICVVAAYCNCAAGRRRKKGSGAEPYQEISAAYQK